MGRKTEEELKTNIFNIYSKFRNDPNRRQVYFGQLWEPIYEWCILNKAKDMGEEIYNFIKRITNVESRANIPQEKEGFFKYLYSSLKTEKSDYYRKYESGIIKIPKEKKQKLKKIKDFIRIEESQLGRKLTTDEQIQGVAKWFKNQEYIDLLNVLNVGSISHVSNDGNGGIDSLNYSAALSDDPIDEYIKKTEMDTVLETVKLLLLKKQERSRGCYRALFTLYCIESYKDFEKLYPVLDSQILEAWHKTGEKPKQYEIYQKYHPNAQKSGAAAMASNNLREFLNDIEICLKEKKQ